MIEQVINMKRIIKAVKSLMLVSALLLCITQARSVGETVRDAIERCMLTVVPSLYAMMIISSLTAKSGILNRLPAALSRISERAGEEAHMFFVLIYSMFAGYPAGATMILSAEKSIDKRTASLLSGICFGAGPAFIFGCISDRLYSSSNAGVIILVSCAAADIVMAVLIQMFMKGKCAILPLKKESSSDSGMLAESILSAGKAMAGICFSITAFSVISFILDFLGVTANAGEVISRLTELEPDTGRQLFCAFLDVTNINGLPKDDLRLLPCISGLVSFGGMCVILQISALARGKFSVKLLIFIRIVSAFLSGMICRIIMPFFLRHEITAASTVTVRLHKEVSPVPSIMLVIMTIMLFAGCNRTEKIPES